MPLKAINLVATAKNTRLSDKPAIGKPYLATTSHTFELLVKRTGIQRRARTMESPWCMYCMYYSRPKGISRVEVTSSSENITPVVFTVIKFFMVV